MFCIYVGSQCEVVCVHSLLAVDPEAEVGSGMELGASVEPVDNISTLVIVSQSAVGCYWSWS